MRGGKVDPRLPFLGAALAKRLRRNPELHERAPFWPVLIVRAM
jgi:hypothetical protein